MIQPDDPLPPSPLPEWELQAVAATVLRQHGEKAPVHVAERIGACAVADDAAGVATWKAVAVRMDAMLKASRGRPN